MSQGVHLLVSFAACAPAAAREQLRTLELPHLKKLLARLAPAGDDTGTVHDLSMPHERVRARAAGLWPGDGRVPEAAWQLAREGRDAGDAAWAWITPCHWAVAQDHIRMHPPGLLELAEDESRALLAAMQPYFEEDGIAIEYRAPTRWLACGEVFRALACASLDRVSGAVVDDWLPRAAEARTIRRLQQEMQMLLYTHAVNESREVRGLAPVNSFWVSGAGALPGDSPRPPLDASLESNDSLRDSALAGDWPAWAQAWRTLDAQVISALRDKVDRGEPVTLTLCGEASARTWAAADRGAWERLTHLFRAAPSPAGALESLT